MRRESPAAPQQAERRAQRPCGPSIRAQLPVRRLASPRPARLPWTVATRSPELTREPFRMWSFDSLPAADDGTSIVAFSVSSVTSGVSSATASPSLTRSSMTSTSLKSPRSGTRTSSAVGAAAGAGDGDLAVDADFGPAVRLAGTLDAAGAAASSTRIAAPLETRSPFLTDTAVTRPAAVDGTSMVALSVSSVMSGVSTATVSPAFTSNSMTSTS